MPTSASSAPGTRGSPPRGGSHQAGKSVVVLEARDRVGGRIWTQQLADGTPVDRGGAWLGAEPRRDLRARATRSASSTYKTWVKGAHLLVDGDRDPPLHGPHPEDQPARGRARSRWRS